MNILFNKSKYILTLLLLALFINTNAQNNLLDAKVNVNMENATLQQIFSSLGKQTDYNFSYGEFILNNKSRFSVRYENEPLLEVLKSLGERTNFKFQVKNKVITISPDNKKLVIKNIKGQIVDNKGAAIIGATIMIKGTGQGTSSDIDGSFSLSNVASDAKISISFIGYVTLELNANTDLSKIVLEEDALMLDATVVTALGIKRSEKALSYNVQKVKATEITTVKDANFVNSLNGKVAGVSIQRSAAGVGGATRVVMRGNKSISGDNNVLYVVDGIPVANQSVRSGDGSGFGAGRVYSEGISNFNTDDIESISILTGPSAAALYGAAAANGVILINTKKGSVGKLRINASSSMEIMNPFVLPQFQNTYGNVAGDSRSWGNKLETPSSFEPKDFFNTGTTFNNSFNFSSGNDKNQTFFSAAAIKSEGIVPNNKYHRYNVTLRNTAKFFNDRLTFDASVSYVREYSNNMVSYGTYFNPIVGAYLYPRGMSFEKEKFFERYNPKLGYNEQYWGAGDFGMNIQNPYWIAYRNLRPEVKDRYMLYASLKYDITKYLNITGRLRLDNTYSEREDKRYASTIGTFAKPKGRYNYFRETFKQKYADLMINFSKNINEDYKANINVGTSFEEYDAKGRGYGGQLLLIPNKFSYNNIDPTTSVPAEDGGNSRKKNIAVFGSAEFSWKSIIYLTLTGRTDYSSQLVNSKDPWIFYPSVGLSAVLTDLLPEDMKHRISPILSYAKIRTSYTEVGSPIPYTGLTPGTRTQKIEGGTIVPYEYYPLSDLKAERTKSYELGLDTRWLDGSISLGVTLYHSNTYNQLLTADLAKGSGYKYMYVQAGNVQNRGIELSLGFHKDINDFSYNTNLTATANRNKIIELASNVVNPVDPTQKLDLSDIQIGRFRLREGGEIGDIYSDKWLKRDKENYVDYSPGGQLLTETTTPYKLGSVNPDWTLGWKNSFDYKGFNLSFLINARLGGIVISQTQAALDRYGVSKASADARDMGDISLGNFKVDPRTYYEAISNLDSYYTYSATNVRLQEMSLSYNISGKVFKNFIESLNVSVYGTNLWMIYNKAPYDPELTASTGTFGQGNDYFMLPSLSTYGLSIKIKF